MKARYQKESDLLDDVQNKNFIDIQKIVNIISTNLEFGRGILFETEDDDLRKFWEKLNKKNNVNGKIYNLILEKNLFGKQILKFDITESGDFFILIPDPENIKATTAYDSEIILMEIINFPLKAEITGGNFKYKIREIWDQETIRIFFYYDKENLTFSQFLTKIPDSFNKQIIKINYKDLKKFKEKSEDKDNFWEKKNPWNEIPAVLFKTHTNKPLFENHEQFQILLNKCFWELANDLVYSRPTSIYKSTSKEAYDYYHKNGVQKPLIFETNVVSSEDSKLVGFSPHERLAVLSATIEKIINLAFNQANVSYIKQLASVPSNANDLANSAGARNSDIARINTDYWLHFYFEKLFRFAGFKDVNFKIKLLEADEQKEQQIANLAQKLALKLTTQKQAQKEMNPENNTINESQIKQEEINIEPNKIKKIT